MKFYLAGKMAGAKWRGEFDKGVSVYPYPDATPEQRRSTLRERMLTPDERVERGVSTGKFPTVPLGFRNHEVVGPFYIPCFHSPLGCYRSENDHGLGVDGNCQDSGFTRGQAVAFCLFAIERCDVFFAWIDDDTCYGTLAEIGYAKGLQKPVWIAGPPDYIEGWATCHAQHTTDLWFACTMADRLHVVDWNTNPLDALREMIGPETREERRDRLVGELVRTSR